MRGCHRKLWENVMEVKLKIEKTNTMTNTWERQRQRQTRIYTNVNFQGIYQVTSGIHFYIQSTHFILVKYMDNLD